MAAARLPQGQYSTSLRLIHSMDDDDDDDAPTPTRQYHLHPSKNADHPFPYVALSVCIYIAWCWVMASILFFLLKEHLRRLAVLLGVLPLPSLPSPPPPAAAGEPGLERCCSICMEEMMSREAQCMLPRCKHVFHRPCIERWLRAAAMACPLRRSSID